MQLKAFLGAAVGLVALLALPTAALAQYNPNDAFYPSAAYYDYGWSPYDYGSYQYGSYDPYPYVYNPSYWSYDPYSYWNSYDPYPYYQPQGCGGYPYYQYGYLPCQTQAQLSATPTSGTAPLSVTFSNVAGSIAFGDGSTQSAQGQVSHTYAQPGTYTASSNSGSVTIVVRPSATNNGALIAVPASGSAPLMVSFFGQNLAQGAQYYLSFGDGAQSEWLSMNGTSGNGSHTYAAPGTYQAALVRISCNGAAYTSSCGNPQQSVAGTATIVVR